MARKRRKKYKQSYINGQLPKKVTPVEEPVLTENVEEGQAVEASSSEAAAAEMTSAASKASLVLDKIKTLWQKKSVRIISIVVLVLLLLLAGIYGVFKSFYSKTTYVSDAEVAVLESLPEDVEEEIDDAESISEETQVKMEKEIQAFEFPNGKDVYNILLIGTDRRDKSWYGNSDAMILLSINKATATMQLTSFMRDSYAKIPGLRGGKLNSAHAYGGGPLLVETIEQNYKVDIDNYAEVEFSGLMDIVDAVGGIDIELRKEELKELNTMAGLHAAKTDREVEPITTGGMHHLSGPQALAYARIRHIGNADYERTQRQRLVISKIIDKARGLSVTELKDLANTCLPFLMHNITEGEVIKLMGDLPRVMTYELKSDRIPYDGLYHSEGENLVPDFGATIKRLHASIYGTDEEDDDDDESDDSIDSKADSKSDKDDKDSADSKSDKDDKDNKDSKSDKADKSEADSKPTSDKDKK